MIFHVVLWRVHIMKLFDIYCPPGFGSEDKDDTIFQNIGVLHSYWTKQH
jgi:hypothetical protein